jgi:hypothetical protein
MKRDRPGPLHGDCIDCIGRHCGQHAVSLTGFESISIPFQPWLNAFLIFLSSFGRKSPFELPFLFRFFSDLKIS